MLKALIGLVVGLIIGVIGGLILAFSFLPDPTMDAEDFDALLRTVAEESEFEIVERGPVKPPPNFPTGMIPHWIRHHPNRKPSTRKHAGKSPAITQFTVRTGTQTLICQAYYLDWRACCIDVFATPDTQEAAHDLKTLLQKQYPLMQITIRQEGDFTAYK